ncbi:MAG: hypothetical protein WBP95_19225, partial [Acidobacteriaceae bacterium]
PLSAAFLNAIRYPLSAVFLNAIRYPLSFYSLFPIPYSLFFLSSIHHLPKVTFGDNTPLTANHIWRVYSLNVIF